MLPNWIVLYVFPLFLAVVAVWGWVREQRIRDEQQNTRCSYCREYHDAHTDH